MRTLIIAVVALGLLATAASADTMKSCLAVLSADPAADVPGVRCSPSTVDVWDCTHTVDDQNAFKVHEQDVVLGDELMINYGRVRERILKNDDKVLIWADSHSWNSPFGGPTTSASVMVIDKRTGAYREGTLFLADRLTGPSAASGSCRKIVGVMRAKKQQATKH